MKKIIYSFIILITSFNLSGCLEKDSLENINIYTTVYPIEYMTEQLYGPNSKIFSIYPSSVNVNTYNLTDKQISDYSKASMFIYEGLSNEKDYAIKMLNKNNNIKIIDAAMGMQYINDQAELWLDPSNALMLVQNIKNGFNEYLTNPYLKNEISNRYDELKIEISEIDAELKLTAENTSNKELVVSSDLFKYLEKYGFSVISIEENENLTDKIIDDASKLMATGKIKYIYVKNNETTSNTVNNLVNKYKVTVIPINTLETKLANQTEDYIKIMYDNIDLIKKELYD